MRKSRQTRPLKSERPSNGTDFPDEHLPSETVYYQLALLSRPRLASIGAYAEAKMHRLNFQLHPASGRGETVPTKPILEDIDMSHLSR